MTVFDLFKQIEYGYVPLQRGTVFGNVTLEEPRMLHGVFKFRQGYTRSGNNMETFSGEVATLHAHPEDFDQSDPIVGNGVIVDGVEYEVSGVTKGTNFDTGIVEHLTLTLKEAHYEEMNDHASE